MRVRTELGELLQTIVPLVKGLLTKSGKLVIQEIIVDHGVTSTRLRVHIVEIQKGHCHQVLLVNI